MCMIAWRPSDAKTGVHIPNRVIDTAMTRHADGFGIAWRDDSGLHTSKYGPSQGKQFRKALKGVDRAGVEYVTHFRFATHGAKDADHAHPYEYTDPTDGRVLVFHNGVINIRTDGDDSDTQVFVRSVIAQLGSRWWDNPALVYLVGEAIGYSKLVLMTDTETISLHDKRGTWDGGIWYSSDHTPSRSVVKVRPPTKAGILDTYKPRDFGYVGGAYNTPDGRWAEGARWVPGAECFEDTQKPENKSTALVPITPWVERQKRARDSARAFGLIAVDDGDTGMIIDNGYVEHLYHYGHRLTPIKAITLLDGDRDYEDGIICDECQTVGTVYVIDGQPLVEMAHFGQDDDEEEDLLPGHGLDLMPAAR